MLTHEIEVVTPEQVVGLLKKGQKVSLVLKSGTCAEGKLETVSPATLRVNVNKSDHVRDLPMGRQALAFDRLTSVTISTLQGNTRKALPFILSSALAPFVVAACIATQGCPFALVMALAASLGGVGYYAGRAMDRRRIKITIQ